MVIFSNRLLFWSDNVEESDIRSHCVIEMALMDGTKRRVVATESQPSHLNVLTSLYCILSFLYVVYLIVLIFLFLNENML